MLQTIRTILWRLFGGVCTFFGVLSILAFITYDKNNASLNTTGTVNNTLTYVIQTWGDILVQFLGISGLFVALVCAVWGGKIAWGKKIYNIAWRRNMLIVNVLFICVGIRYFNIPLFSITQNVDVYAHSGGEIRFIEQLTQDINVYAHGLIGHILYSYTLAYADTYALWGAYILLGLSMLMGIYILSIAGRDFKNILWKCTHAMGWVYKKIAHIIQKISSRQNKDSQAQMDKTLNTIHKSLGSKTNDIPPFNMAKESIKSAPKAHFKKPRTANKIMPIPMSDAFELPPLDLLKDLQSNHNKISKSELDDTRQQLEQTLLDFKVNGEIVGIRMGPVVTTYELQLAAGVRENRVIGLADDIARTMGAESIRISRIPGRTVIGIELPNTIRETVSFKNIIASDTFQDANMVLPLVLGRDVEGAVAVADLASMPHLLIAGTTGSGKSVGINAMILSLLYKYTPDQLKMIMVDPKMLEFSMYEDIPHLLSPVVTEPSKAVVALKWAVMEMNRRYNHMSKLGVRNVSGYNTKVAKLKKSGEIFMESVTTGFNENGEPIIEQHPQELQHYPYIVVIVDEMADLMLTAGKDINNSIQSLAQKARAAGIHIILATQRPSTDVITGTIRANFPARISYRVTSKIDSRVILNEGGAEQLLGRGDMLFYNTKITRNHAPFVQDIEVEKVCDWLRAQESPEYVDAVTDTNILDGDIRATLDMDTSNSKGNSDFDPLYDEAVALVTRTRKASTSFVQRSLKIGYNRAANIIEQLEQDGVISEATATGKRTVLAPEGNYE